MKFQDQAVLVTGGGSGIGQQVCHAMAAEGARVAVSDVDLSKAEHTVGEIAKKGGEAHAFQLDVVNPKAVTAFVVKESGSDIDAARVIEHCRASIAGYKKPRHVLFVDSLPRNTTNKIDKNALRARFARVSSTRPPK